MAVGTTLTHPRAHALMYALAAARSWPYAVWCAADVECALMGVVDWPLDRDLTPAQWRAVAATPAWDQLPAIAYQAVIDSDILDDAIRQAGLVCVDCAALLDGPLTATWGRCPTCRVAVPLATLQHSACPGDDETGHDWTPDGCARCGLPAPELVRCSCCQRYVARVAAHEHPDGPVADLCCRESHPVQP